MRPKLIQHSSYPDTFPSVYFKLASVPLYHSETWKKYKKESAFHRYIQNLDFFLDHFSITETEHLTLG